MRQLRSHICLFASFDASLDADLSRGDGGATANADAVQFDPHAGRYGGALVFSAADHGWAEDEFTYRAAGNFPYSEHGFAGTVSLWLNGDPDADLCDEVPVDPFHISRHAADGSFYLDLTRPHDSRYGSPRKLRFGLYGDSPEQDKFVGGQLVVVGELGWRRGEWHHVVATWRQANSGQEDGAAAIYIDGVRRGWMEGYRHQLRWNTEDMTIGLGQRYCGVLDELLILDCELKADEVQDLYAMTGPLSKAL